ncbi:BOW99_gp33 family protein [Streptococcus ferus]|uniref:BOW99_gp33 family protein n=1 Tax=Streptococcus ferus TaxID=1345 RepID=UPI00359FAB3B
MAKHKEKWNPRITHILPKGAKLADGTILEKETTLSQEEFDKNPPVIPAGHPYYKIMARIIREKIEKGEL